MNVFASLCCSGKPYLVKLPSGMAVHNCELSKLCCLRLAKIFVGLIVEGVLLDRQEAGHINATTVFEVSE